jgi:tetratricopeptide (TPR) repeat protein
MGRYQEAVQVLKRTITAYPNLLVAHIAMVVAYEELGRHEDARSEAAEIVRISPQFARAAQPGFKAFAMNQRWEDDLRKAGLE